MSATATAVRSPGDDGPLPGHHIDARVYRRRWKTLGVLSLSLLIIGLDNTVLNVALPTLQTHFAASASTLQWIVDAYLLAFAGVLLTMGTLGDRFGRKRALQAGLVVFGVASVLAAFAQNATQLIALRAVMGIGGAMIMPATLSVIMDVFPREERGKAIGDLVGDRRRRHRPRPVRRRPAPRVVLVELGLLAQRPDRRRRPRRRLRPRARRAATREPGAFDLPGAGLSIATLVTLVYGIIEATPARLDRSARARLLRRRRACSAPPSSRGSAASPDPMLPLGFFRDPRFTVASVGVGLVFFAMMGSVFAFTQYLQFAHGFSALEAGARDDPARTGARRRLRRLEPARRCASAGRA